MLNDRKEREELFGPKKPMIEIIRACHALLEEIGEHPDPIPTETEDEQVLEDQVEGLVHEMAHHVALLNSVDFTEDRDKRIGSAIGLLTPAQRTGNEIDTLAIELEALWWLHVPQNPAELVRLAMPGMDMEISARAVCRAVKHLRDISEIANLGKALAYVIYEEIELQKREDDADPRS